MPHVPPAHPAIALSLCLTLAALTAAARSDCRSRRIPDGLNVVIFLGGCGFQFCFAGPDGLVTSVLGMGMGLALSLPLYLFAGLGGGDVKLLAAAGAFLGPIHTVTAAVWAALMAGAVAVLAVGASPDRMLTLRRWAALLRLAPQSPASVHAADPGKRRMPMAPALTLGVLAVILQSADFARIFAIRELLDLIRCTA
ncbi:A24 family peptidase [Methylolobus aquaticus]